MAAAIPQSHKLRVLSAYRNCIRLRQDWYQPREMFIEDVEKIRAEFKANMHITDLVTAQRLVGDVEKKLFDVRGFEPYIYPTLPGGTKYERNPPFPPELLTEEDVQIFEEEQAAKHHHHDDHH